MTCMKVIIISFHYQTHDHKEDKKKGEGDEKTDQKGVSSSIETRIDIKVIQIPLSLNSTGKKGNRTIKVLSLFSFN